MLSAIHNRFFNLGTWPFVALLVVVFILCQQGFVWRQRALGGLSEVPDARFGYTPREIRNLFEDWGVGRRELYARTEVTLDLAFPLVYGTLFAVFSARLFRKGLWRWALLVPLSGALADLIENFMIAYLAWSYDGHESPLVRAAACFTEVKLVCFIASLLLLLAGGVAGFRRDKTSIQI
jgi:hypothetical protein